MTKQESLRILDKCIEYLDSLSDDEINKLADEADKYMTKPFDKTRQANSNNDKFVRSDKNMDVESIIDTIDALTCGHLDLYDIEPYMNTIMESLEKQMPKKVIWENEKNSKTYLFSWAYCPNCGSDMCDKHNEEFQFCPDCGQALDWSEEVEECIPGW